jgi:hypothetical protein
MKLLLLTLALSFPMFTMASATPQLTADAPLVYINQNFGFNVKGYKYAQAEYPCDIDKVLVENLISRAKSAGIRLEAINTIDKIQNGVVPVLAIDIEQLVLGDQERQFGTKQGSNLPKVQITAALVKNKDSFLTAKHTCAIATLNQFSPTSDVMDLGSNGVTVCSATRKCLQDLSKDVVEWIAPQIK